MADRHIAAPQHNQGAQDSCEPQLLICDKCPAAAMAIEPGSDGVCELFLLRRAVPRRQWCRECWPASLPARVLP